MAELYAVHVWADGSRVSFHVEAEVTGPDCIDMLRPTVVRGLGEVLARVAEGEDVAVVDEGLED